MKSIELDCSRIRNLSMEANDNITLKSWTDALRTALPLWQRLISETRHSWAWLVLGWERERKGRVPALISSVTRSFVSNHCRQVSRSCCAMRTGGRSPQRPVFGTADDVPGCSRLAAQWLISGLGTPAGWQWAAAGPWVGLPPIGAVAAALPIDLTATSTPPRFTQTDPQRPPDRPVAPIWWRWREGSLQPLHYQKT